MQIASLASIPRASLAGEPPAPEPTGNSFAQLLGQQQAPAAEAPRAPAERASTEPADSNTASDTAEAAPDERTVRDRTSRPRAPAKPATRGAESKREGEATGRADEAGAKTEETARDGTAAASDDASLRSWLATLHLPHHDGAAPAIATPASSRTESAGATGQPEITLDAMTAGAGSSAPTAPALPGAAGAARGASRDKGAAFGTLEAAAGREIPAAADAPTAGAAGKTAEASFTPIDTLTRAIAPEAAAAPAGSHPTAIGGAQDAPAPTQVPVATAFDDPLFPRAFGVQVSVLARDGVQQAELHLNPAETGPVSVQIVMDGTQARIDFGADAAATRERIEHSLPDLAAALREAGLTLTGGGVSQHANSRGDSPGTPAQPRAEAVGHAAATAAETAARAPVRRVTVGALDLYA